jgi:hypothetical protein
MKKLLIGLLALSSFSSFAGLLNNFADKQEIKKCSKQLLKTLKESSTKKDLRYLYHLDSYPLIHVYAVYEELSAEPVDIVRMVKHPGQKCKKY